MSLFKKSKKNTHADSPALSPKVAKADKLRQAQNKAGKEWSNIVAQWTKKANAARTSEERKTIDSVYQKKVEQAEERHYKAYSEYYDYVQKNFTDSQLATSKAANNFTGKAFINRLNKVVKAKDKSK